MCGVLTVQFDLAVFGHTQNAGLPAREYSHHLDLFKSPGEKTNEGLRQPVWARCSWTPHFRFFNSNSSFSNSILCRRVRLNLRICESRFCFESHKFLAQDSGLSCFCFSFDWSLFRSPFLLFLVSLSIPFCPVDISMAHSPLFHFVPFICHVSVSLCWFLFSGFFVTLSSQIVSSHRPFDTIPSCVSRSFSLSLSPLLFSVSLSLSQSFSLRLSLSPSPFLSRSLFNPCYPIRPHLSELPFEST